jgi:hypothetical protein
VAASAASPHSAAKVEATHFALQASGYASRVVGGAVPAGSDRSAFAVIGCTNKAGLSHGNAEAAVDLGQAIGLKAAHTHVWTTQRGGTVSSWSRDSIARVRIGGAVGALVLRGVSSTSRAWNDGGGFHAATTARLASIVLHPAVGPDQSFPVPDPGQSVTVPGVATITLARGTRAHTGSGAQATLDAVRVRVIPTGTRLFVAHSRALISGGVKTALFGGSAFGSRASALDGAVTSGRTPSILMPCEGTAGRQAKKSIAHADLATNAFARALTATQSAGVRGDGTAVITESAHIARVNLGGGLRIRSITGRAHVEKRGHRYARTAKGTSAGIVTLNGNRLRFPRTGALTIPGVARLRPTIVTKTRNSIAVTALRITLLDGRAAVIDLGYAKALIRPSGA